MNNICRTLYEEDSIEKYFMYNSTLSPLGKPPFARSSISDSSASFSEYSFAFFSR